MKIEKYIIMSDELNNDCKYGYELKEFAMTLLSSIISAKWFDTIVEAEDYLLKSNLREFGYIKKIIIEETSI